MAESIPPSGGQAGESDKPGNGQATPASEVELLKVVVAREGRKVSAQWAIHPQMKQDLQPEELKELAELMGQVTGLVGKRFAEILAEIEPDKPGTA